MRVLWLTENYPPGRGGMAESCDRIVHGLREHLAIDLVHFSRSASAVQIETRRSGRDILYPLTDDPAHSLLCLWNRLNLPSAPSYSHVCAFGGQAPLLSGPVYAAWLGVPFVCLLRGNDFDVAMFTPARRALLRDALSAAVRVCVVSTDHVRKISAYYPGVVSVCIPNGIDTASFQALPSDRKRALELRASSLTPGTRLLGFFGHLKRKKGVLFFLECLLRSGHAERFSLLFSGEMDAELRAFLSMHAAALPHTVLPFCDRYELLQRYSACDVIAVPSFYDGMPNVVLEAAALGLPLLCSTAGGMGDILRDGEHGLLFHPGDEESCGRAIAELAELPDERLQSIGQAVQARIRERFTADAETAAYLSMLRATVKAA